MIESKAEFVRQLHLANKPTPEGITLAKDLDDNLYVGGYGGQGSTIWNQLKPGHPFLHYVNELTDCDFLIPQEFRYNYYAGGIDLSELKLCDTAVYRNLILLDIDGVILPFPEGYGEIPDNKSQFLQTVSFNRNCIDKVLQLCEKTDTKIMLISRWRKIFQDDIDLLKQALIRSGVKEAYFTDPWYCPYKFTSDKSHEMNLAVEAFRKSNDENVRVLVIDDDPVVYEEEDTASISSIFDDLADNHKEGLSLFFQIMPNPTIGMSDADLAEGLNLLSF